MGFWIYMASMALFLPLIMIGFGSYFVKKAPAKINAVFGYRTPMSMKNRDTWVFAHKHCGRIWRISGWVWLPVSAAVMLAAAGREQGTIGFVGAVLMLVQTLFLIAMVLPTELALRKHFDHDGTPKQSRQAEPCRQAHEEEVTNYE